MASTLADVRQGVVLLAGEWSVDLLVEGFAEAEDDVERGTQFVAHHGEELILETEGTGEFCVGLAEDVGVSLERYGILLARTDILDGEHPQAEAAIRSVDWRTATAQPTHRTPSKLAHTELYSTEALPPHHTGDWPLFAGELLAIGANGDETTLGVKFGLRTHMALCTD